MNKNNDYRFMCCDCRHYNKISPDFPDNACADSYCNKFQWLVDWYDKPCKQFEPIKD